MRGLDVGVGGAHPLFGLRHSFRKLSGLAGEPRSLGCLLLKAGTLLGNGPNRVQSGVLGLVKRCGQGVLGRFQVRQRNLGGVQTRLVGGEGGFSVRQSGGSLGVLRFSLVAA